MKVLYLNVAADMTETPNLLKDMQYQVTSVTAFHDALKLIQMESFDALVIEEGQMHPGTLVSFQSRGASGQNCQYLWGASGVRIFRWLCSHSKRSLQPRRFIEAAFPNQLKLRR